MCRRMRHGLGLSQRLAPMARQKQEVERVAPGEIIGSVSPLAEELAREIRQGLESKTKTLLTHKEPGNMGLKERQKVATDLVVSLFAHPKFQERYVEWSLDNPGRFGAQVVALLPKSMEIEKTDLRERVIVIGQASESDWQEAVKSMQTISDGAVPWDTKVIDAECDK